MGEYWRHWHNHTARYSQEKFRQKHISSLFKIHPEQCLLSNRWLWDKLALHHIALPTKYFCILFTLFFACMSMCVFAMCGYSWVSGHVLRAENNLEELVGFLFLSCRFWGSSSGCQAWKQVFTYCATVLAHKIILRRLFVFIIFTSIPYLSQESSPPNTHLVRLSFPIFCPSFIFPSFKDYNFSRLVSSFKDYNFTLLLFWHNRRPTCCWKRWKKDKRAEEYSSISHLPCKHLMPYK